MSREVAARDWRFTDDREDPCGLCVQWEEQPDDPLGEKARPIWPDGSSVERIYRFTHQVCSDAAIAYTSEATE